MKFRVIITLTTCLSLLMWSTNCTYWKTKKVNEKQSIIQSINESLDKDDAFFIKTEDQLYIMNNIEATETSLIADVSKMDSSNYYDHKNIWNNSFKRLKNDQKYILNEVYFYLNNFDETNLNSRQEISFRNIDSLTIIQNNQEKSIVMGTLSAIGIAGLVALIIVATKSSCPFIYSIDDDGNIIFEGEMLSGSVQPQLQRSDILKLTEMPDSQERQVRILNALKENEYLDEVKLIYVNHPEEVKVVFDQHGKMHTIKNTTPSHKVLTDNGKNITELLSHSGDNQYYNFIEGIDSLNTRGLNLSFPRKPDQNQAKLYIKAKASFWLDFTYSQLTNHFGVFYNEWQENQKSKTKNELLEWKKNQDIPLKVSKKVNGSWREVENLEIKGPFGDFYEMVVAFDWKGVPSTGNLEIRLESGFLFWELDYVGIDYSPDMELEIEVVKPKIAIDHSGKSIIEEIAQTDQLFHEQLIRGHESYFTFAPPEFKNKYNHTSTFLMLNGYYQPRKELTSLPDYDFLMSFKNPGRLAEYSRYNYEILKYKEILNESESEIAKTDM